MEARKIYLYHEDSQSVDSSGLAMSVHSDPKKQKPSQDRLILHELVNNIRTQLALVQIYDYTRSIYITYINCIYRSHAFHKPKNKVSYI